MTPTKDKLAPMFRLLVELATDSALWRRYACQPDAVLQEFGLHAEDRAVLQHSDRIEDVLSPAGSQETNTHSAPAAERARSTVDRGRGSLTIVGTGILVAGDTSLAARDCIARAEKVFYGASNGGTAGWIQSLNPAAENLLDSSFERGKPMLEVYDDVIERILSSVREGIDLCVAFYGHPGFFVYPSHEAIRRAREEGYPARMLPAVSALDWLFADLGIDPARDGCQIYKATDYLLRRRSRDTSSGLVLLQVGLLHTATWRGSAEGGRQCLLLLQKVLERRYGTCHEAVAYTAAAYPTCQPSIESFQLGALSQASVTPDSTVYVPPKGEAPVDVALRLRLMKARSGRDNTSPKMR